MSLHKEICKYIIKTGSKDIKKLEYEPTKRKTNRLTEAFKNAIFPYYFKFIRGPFERWQYCATTKFLREHGNTKKCDK